MVIHVRLRIGYCRMGNGVIACRLGKSGDGKNKEKGEEQHGKSRGSHYSFLLLWENSELQGAETLHLLWITCKYLLWLYVLGKSKLSKVANAGVATKRHQVSHLGWAPWEGHSANALMIPVVDRRSTSLKYPN